MKHFFTTKTIAGLGMLTAMVVVLQLLSNYVQFGPVSITLALFPIAVGAMLFGPFGGLFLGLVDGVLVLLAPSTISVFFAYNPIGTMIVCLLKTGLAGLCAGFIFKLFQKKNIKLALSLLHYPFQLLTLDYSLLLLLHSLNSYYLLECQTLIKPLSIHSLSFGLVGTSS